MLVAAGYRFDIVAGGVDETPLPGEAAWDYAARIARAKSQSFAAADAISLGADTIVVHDSELMGKPAGAPGAIAMLEKLSGSTHEVMTGWALSRDGDVLLDGVEVTEVTFRTLSPDDISTYVATGEPMDRAGAYAIQGGAGTFVEQIDGSFDNVAGLPMEVVASALAELGILPLRR